jgi:SAM-dependent methyltransferase
MEDAAFADEFTAAMDCRGVYLGQALAGSVDLSSARQLLDVGGGSGIYACALLAVNPQLRATVLEKPPVDRVAAKAVAARGYGQRIDVHAADMFDGAWPAAADVHLLSNVLHDWNETTVGKLLKASFDALRPGGTLIVHDAFINARKDGPLAVASYSALLMHSTQGKCYSTAECEALLASAGFHCIEYQPTVADRGRMLAVKPSSVRRA